MYIIRQLPQNYPSTGNYFIIVSAFMKTALPEHAVWGDMASARTQDSHRWRTIKKAASRRQPFSEPFFVLEPYLCINTRLLSMPEFVFMVTTYHPVETSSAFQERL